MTSPSGHLTTAVETQHATSRLKITVVVPVLNEAEFVGQTLDALLTQEYPQEAFEVVVVDGISTDRTCEVVESYLDNYPNLRLHSNPQKWSSAARNIGIKSTSGDVVIVVDGHCEFYDNQYLKNVEIAFERGDVDCLGRPQPLDIRNGTLLQVSIAAARSSKLGHHPDSFIYSMKERTVPAQSVAVAYRRSVFDHVGLFDESFDACEDVELNHRVDKAGLTCLLAPRIRLKYHPRANLRGLFRQMSRYGRGRIRLLRKHRDTFSTKSLIPTFFLIFIILGSLISVFVPSFRIVYFSVLGLYAVIVAGFSLAIALASRRLHMLWMLPPVFAAIHFGAGYGSLKELIWGSNKTDPLDR